MEEIILVNLIILVGACVQCVIGYGLGLVCAPLLFMINPDYVPVPMIANSFALCVLQVIKAHKSLRLNEVSWAVAGNMTGIVLAVVIMLFLSATDFSLIFGLLILAAVLTSFRGYRPVVNRTTSLVAGFASGVMGVFTSIGGPPIALLYQSASSQKILANLPAFFLATTTFALVALYLADHFQQQQFELFLHCLPGVFAGFLIAPLFQKRLAEKSLRPFILTVAGVSGLYSVVVGLVSYLQ